VPPPLSPSSPLLLLVPPSQSLPPPSLPLTSLQVKSGLPCSYQILTHSGRILDDISTLVEAGIGPHSTVTCTSRLLGGKPTKVKLMTSHLPCGGEVTIDIEKDASKEEIKAKLEVATGVPVEHQKVMLSGINQIVMGDKR
jgi:hypothetical protein